MLSQSSQPGQMHNKATAIISLRNVWYGWMIRIPLSLLSASLSFFLSRCFCLEQRCHYQRWTFSDPLTLPKMTSSLGPFFCNLRISICCQTVAQWKDEAPGKEQIFVIVAGGDVKIRVISQCGRVLAACGSVKYSGLFTRAPNALADWPWHFL